ncbi:MAG: 3-methyl-2-oxobutanoate hydroxymethyltransferase [Chloroflexota bacterium]|nr:3-methyl-2-oxobutanoate hydroxymethyltransferase [Chloroflexota bacterium]
MVTAYDHPTASLADEAGVDSILVGDSIGNNVLGYSSTLPVTMDEMVTHCRAVSSAVRRAFVVGDLPYMSYQPSPRDAVLNAGRLMSEGGADAVKLEGGAPMLAAITAIVGAGIPVLGHIGLTPQSAAALGGLKVQGREATDAARLLDEAKALEEAGVFGLVLEAVPARVAWIITESVRVLTIGIGAGVHCDGQVLIMHDMFGLSAHKPRFAKQYADIGAMFRAGFEAYRADVKAREFPAEEHSFKIKAEELQRLESLRDTAGTPG